MSSLIRPPGFTRLNRQHPLVATGGLRFAVAQQGGYTFRDEVTGRGAIPSQVNSQISVYKYLGHCYQTVFPDRNPSFSGMPDTVWSAGFIGLIYQTNAGNGSEYLFNNGSLTVTGDWDAAFSINKSGGGSALAVGGGAWTGAARGYSSFTAYTWDTGAAAAYGLMYNMETGRIVASTRVTDTAFTAATASSTWGLWGYSQNNGNNGKFAAIIVGSRFLSVPEMNQWAADPWSPWRPSIQFYGYNTVAGAAAIAARQLIIKQALVRAAYW